MHGPTGRSERRTARTIAVELSRLGEPLLNERTFTENVSPRGARVVTEREWQPGANLLLISLKDDVRSQAQIVYCARLAKGRFAVGLELSTRVEQWAKPR
jgi:PilZ domain-containing protein